ncbi:MAG: LCP family protein [Actinomycetota bacterium]|nr:LCP family protein [Actinomycetota bacterium]
MPADGQEAPALITRADLALRRKRRRRRRLLTTSIVLVALVVLIAGAGFAYVAYRNSQIKHLTIHGLDIVPPSGVDNVLLVGNNSRCVLHGAGAQNFGTCAQVGGARSDVTMVLHLDPAHHRASLLSIPRDLFLPIPGTTQANRVDSALNFGPQRLVQTVEDDLGIPINHFIELNFNTFQGVVNALGGLNMYFPDPVRDYYSGLDITTSGCHHLNGAQALALVRARHMYYWVNGVRYYDPTGDLSRIKRDHEFLKVLGAQVEKQALTNPLTANAVIGSVAPDLQTDFSITSLLSLAITFRHVNPGSVPTATLPVYIDPNSYYYRGADYGDVVLPEQPVDQQYVDTFLGLKKPPGSSIAPGSVSVSVLNGTGAYNQAANTSSALRALGFDIVGIGDATSVGPVSSTVVYYSPGHITQAQRVAQELSGSVTIGQGPTADGAEVTVVTGSDFSVAQPPATQQASTGGSNGAGGAPGSSGSPGSAPASGYSDTSAAASLAPYTAATTLPPYDPRSCSPSGGPGS